MTDQSNTGQTEAGDVTTVSAVFGEIVWLLVQSPLHRHQFLVDLEWMVMTPMLLKQYKLFHAQGKPAGVAFWAYVNDEVEARLKSGEAKKLAPQEWKCGEKPVLIDLVTPFGGREEMMTDLNEKVFVESHLSILGSS